jgi:hypothetical protein
VGMTWQSRCGWPEDRRSRQSLRIASTPFWSLSAVLCLRGAQLRHGRVVRVVRGSREHWP